MKQVVIYHDNCLDGFGAAFAAWLKFGDNATYIAASYGKPLPEIKNLKETDLYILDFSFPKEEMERLFLESKRVIWIDHHKASFDSMLGAEYLTSGNSSYKLVQGSVIVILDNLKSGAVLTWEYFFPTEKASILFRMIEDHDLWKFKLPNTEQITTAITASKPWSFNQWYRNFYVLEGVDEYDKLVKLGNILLDEKKRQIEDIVKNNQMTCRIAGTQGTAANCPVHLCNEVGNELAKVLESWGMAWYMRKDGTIKCSLRSNGQDVDALAKKYGGGGHKTAAGFICSTDQLLDILGLDL